MRVLLRLEFLFRGLDFALAGQTDWHSRSGVSQVLDLAEIVARSDLRNDLGKELERVAAVLTAMENSPNVDTPRLRELLDEMDRAIDSLHADTRPVGQALLDSELIASLRRRHHLTLGNCDFDQPAYLHWLARPPEQRTAEVRAWLEPLQSLRLGMTLVLRLVRHAAAAADEVAANGFYQRSLDPSQPNQMVRIILDNESPYYPEVSAGRHRFSVRFLRFVPRGRPPAAEENVSFKLMCCTL